MRVTINCTFSCGSASGSKSVGATEVDPPGGGSSGGDGPDLTRRLLAETWRVIRYTRAWLAGWRNTDGSIDGRSRAVTPTLDVCGDTDFFTESLRTLCAEEIEGVREPEPLENDEDRNLVRPALT